MGNDNEQDPRVLGVTLDDMRNALGLIVERGGATAADLESALRRAREDRVSADSDDVLRAGLDALRAPQSWPARPFNKEDGKRPWYDPEVGPVDPGEVPFPDPDKPPADWYICTCENRPQLLPAGGEVRCKECVRFEGKVREDYLLRIIGFLWMLLDDIDKLEYLRIDDTIFRANVYSKHRRRFETEITTDGQTLQLADGTEVPHGR